MKKRTIISALLGYFTGCLIASVCAGHLGLIIYAIRWAPLALILSFGEYCRWGYSSTYISVAATFQLVAFTIIGKKKNIPALIYIATFIALTVFAFFGGSTGIDLETL